MRESVRARARLHNIIAPGNGGNKQTRLSPVHTVTLAGFRLRRRRRRRYKGFAKLHVAEPRRNFDLMGHARGEEGGGGHTSRNDAAYVASSFLHEICHRDCNSGSEYAKTFPFSFSFVIGNISCAGSRIFEIHFRKFTRGNCVDIPRSARNSRIMRHFSTTCFFAHARTYYRRSSKYLKIRDSVFTSHILLFFFFIIILGN